MESEFVNNQNQAQSEFLNEQLDDYLNRCVSYIAQLREVRDKNPRVVTPTHAEKVKEAYQALSLVYFQIDMVNTPES